MTDLVHLDDVYLYNFRYYQAKNLLAETVAERLQCEFTKQEKQKTKKNKKPKKTEKTGNRFYTEIIQEMS